MSNDKEPCHNFMHGVRFRERPCFSGEPCARLSQGAIPTLHVIGLPACFANTLVCFSRKNQLVGFPEITITLATFVRRHNLLPQFATSRFAPIANHKGYDLASLTAHDRPQPAFVPSFLDK